MVLEEAVPADMAGVAARAQLDRRRGQGQS